MPFSFDALLGSHEKALALRQQRMMLIAGNLANADTPGYKARDIDFAEALKSATSRNLPVHTTRPGHISPAPTLSTQAALKYRIPQQAALDGNTVDMQAERARFADNAVRYQATLRFISGRFKGVIGALKGE